VSSHFNQKLGFSNWLASVAYILEKPKREIEQEAIAWRPYFDADMRPSTAIAARNQQSNTRGSGCTAGDVMSGCIWTPPDCNRLVGQDLIAGFKAAHSLSTSASK
jgi:hypothetical protein